MTRLKLALLMLAAIFLTNSCDKDKMVNCEEHKVADCGEGESKTNIRIENISDFDFCNVVLDPGNKSTTSEISKRMKLPVTDLLIFP